MAKLREDWYIAAEPDISGKRALTKQRLCLVCGKHWIKQSSKKCFNCLSITLDPALLKPNPEAKQNYRPKRLIKDGPPVAIGSLWYNKQGILLRVVCINQTSGLGWWAKLEPVIYVTDDAIVKDTLTKTTSSVSVSFYDGFLRAFTGQEKN